MLTIKIPRNNYLERKYCINVVFKEFLNLKYRLIKGGNCYEISFENKKLIIEDHFFNRFQKNKEYLNIKNLPSNLKIINNEFIDNESIPIIYGTSYLHVQIGSIQCGVDIFASIIFMLSRWEEYVNAKRDYHDRFSSIDSIAYKFNFLQRPIVNEYVSMLRNMLSYLKIIEKQWSLKRQLFLTHDVDKINLWNNWRHFFRAIVGDVIKRKEPLLAAEKIYNIIENKINIYNQYDTFDYLMNLSDSL